MWVVGVAAPAVLDVLRVRHAVAELHDRGVALALGVRAASDRARQLRDAPSDLPRDAIGDPLELIGRVVADAVEDRRRAARSSG